MQVTLRVLAVAVTVHGLLFAAAAWLVSSQLTGRFPAAEQAYFFGLVVPALILAAPLNKLLWWLGLMAAPGWFAWPEPLGFMLAYACWTAALGAASCLAPQRKKGRRKAPPLSS